MEAVQIVNKISKDDNKQRNTPSIVRVNLKSCSTSLERKVGYKCSADVIAHYVHAEKRYKEKIMRHRCNKDADCVRLSKVKSVEEKKLSNKKRTDKRQQVL